MSCFGGCCIDLVSGAPVTGGGAAAAAGWVCVYEVDWRDAFTALGAVDLNSPGATLTFQNVTYATPSIANSGFDQIASTSWGLTANGLEVMGAGVSGIAANGFTAQHIFANLADIAANDSQSFDGDPTRNYLLQVFVSDLNGNANTEESGVALYTITGEPSGSGFSQSAATIGQNAGVAAIPSFVAGNTGSVVRLNRTDLTELDVPTIHYAGTGKAIDGYAAAFAAGDFPDNEDLRFIGSYAETLEVDNDTPGDPFEGFRVAMFHHATTVGNTYNATIQRYRICQR